MQTPEEYEITERVATLFKQLKKQKGYTKKVISEKLGIGLTTLDDYLNGVSSFKVGTLLKVAQLCRVNIGDLMTGNGQFAAQLKESDADNCKAESTSKASDSER
ncbi:helix-turn-helix domain-containing protein [Pseudoalteromonas fenneropenaei]|uniref:Helix-turn-helix domain-containing protein n=1 Tax=Pseudoalteromonas fenneropenaei TaxID=1737459 RepID=A0ABV7CNX6_9GAMM